MIEASEISETKQSYESFIDSSYPSWLTIVLIVIGVFGNTLSLIVFKKMNTQKNSTYIYLTVLCFIDLLTLIFGLGELIVLYNFKFVIRTYSIYICRIQTFIVYSCSHLSSFILTAVSVDRAIATNAINFARKYCKPNVAYKIIISLCCLVICINFHTLIFIGYEEIGNNEWNNTNQTFLVLCEPIKIEIYEEFFNNYYNWIDLIFYAFLPFFIMGLCTFLIIKVLYQSRKRLKRILKKDSSRKENKSLIQSEQKSATFQPSARNNKKNKTLHLTYTLISINILFVSLVSPLVIVRIAFPNVDARVVNILYLLQYANHTFNFIFYGLSSTVYRENVKKLLGFGKKTNNVLVLVNANPKNDENNHEIKNIKLNDSDKSNINLANMCINQEDNRESVDYINSNVIEIDHLENLEKRYLF
jgi:hypothetical protein